MGERVLIEGETGKVLGMAVLVYVLPIVLFFIGYALGCGAVYRRRGRGDWRRGTVRRRILGAIWYSRRMKAQGQVPYEITKRL